jgi:DNA-binding response OmpR family regulator
MSVLLAEDDDDTAAGTTALLRTSLYVVHRARTVAEAEAIAQADSPHIALVDERLPDGSGIKLVRVIRSILPASFIAVITADPLRWHETAAIEAGADVLMAKPVDWPALLKVMPPAQAAE